MYPPQRQPVSYSPYPPQNQGYQAVYYAQPVFPYQNYQQQKINPLGYQQETPSLIGPPPIPPPPHLQAPIPPPDNIYMNYQQPQQHPIHQPPLPPQHLQPQIHQPQFPPQMPRQYEITHPIGQIQQPIPIARQRPIPDQYIPQPIKNKGKPIYNNPTPNQISSLQKQILQPSQPPPRAQLNPIIVNQQIQQKNQQQRNYQQLQQPFNNSKPKKLPAEIKSGDEFPMSSPKIHFTVKDEIPPGCFDIIGRGNLPSIYFTTDISFS